MTCRPALVLAALTPAAVAAQLADPGASLSLGHAQYLEAKRALVLTVMMLAGAWSAAAQHAEDASDGGSNGARRTSGDVFFGGGISLGVSPK